ncbi:uncharacterized protein LOC106722034 [Alligator sinensis]|uniref:Uncharacterized protein LOC106722034 n=1 Tax=Alligator sinensis TaxID=38654 RepID=A0A3Q0GDD9_ALLSI|nr:uncharacterized protein LOC106722034 [Alligator sinensis]
MEVPLAACPCYTSPITPCEPLVCRGEKVSLCGGADAPLAAWSCSSRGRDSGYNVDPASHVQAHNCCSALGSRRLKGSQSWDRAVWFCKGEARPAKVGVTYSLTPPSSLTPCRWLPALPRLFLSVPSFSPMRAPCGCKSARPPLLSHPWLAVPRCTDRLCTHAHIARPLPGLCAAPVMRVVKLLSAALSLCVVSMYPGCMIRERLIVHRRQTKPVDAWMGCTTYALISFWAPWRRLICLGLWHARCGVLPGHVTRTPVRWPSSVLAPPRLSSCGAHLSSIKRDEQRLPGPAALLQCKEGSLGGWRGPCVGWRGGSRGNEVLKVMGVFSLLPKTVQAGANEGP